MKALIHWMMTFSFLWSQTVVAATPAAQVLPITHARDLIKATGITKKPTRMRDVFEATKDRLPLDFRYEVERFLEIYPNYKLPQGNVRSVKNGQHEDMQLTFVQGKQSISILFSLRGDDVGSITFSKGGKDVHRKLTQGDLANPVELVASMLGSDQMLTKQFAFTRLLYSEELSHLKPEQAKNYMTSLQKAIEGMEKVQAAWVAQRLKKTSRWQLLLGDFATADEGELNGKDCITPGAWIGKFKVLVGGIVCVPPEAAKKHPDPMNPSVETETCNPAVYGGAYKTTYQYAFVKADGGPSAAHCQAQAKEKGFEPVVKWSKTEELDAELKRVNDHLNKLTELCATNEAVKDQQKDMCEALNVQLQDVRLRTAQYHSERKGPGSPEGTKAAGVDITPKEVTKGEGKTPVDDREKGSKQKPKQVAATGVCQGLPTDSDMDCGRGHPTSITCANGETRYYCICQPGTTQIRADGGKTIRCGGGRSGSYDRDRDRGRRDVVDEGRWYDKPVNFVKNNWAPLLTIAAIIGGGLLMIKANESSSMESIRQYYNINAPSTPQFAAPAVTSAPGIVSPQFPSIPGRTSVPSAYTGGGYSFPTSYVVPGGPVGGVLKRGIRNSTTGQ